MTASCSYFADVDISEENNSYWQQSVDAGNTVGVKTEDILLKRGV